MDPWNAFHESDAQARAIQEAAVFSPSLARFDVAHLCWHSLLAAFRCQFTLGGWARFVQWVTGTMLCPEEHTITQILSSLGLESQ